MYSVDPLIVLQSWINIDPKIDFAQAFANKILRGPQKSPLIHNEVAQKVNATIRDFFHKYESCFDEYDQPYLFHLLAHVHRFKRATSLFHHRSKRPTKLEKRIKEAINLTKQRKSLSYLPTDVLKICDGYGSIQDCLQLHILGRTPAPEILDYILNSNSLQRVEDFAKNIFAQYNAKIKTTRKVIQTFFKFACTSSQFHFAYTMFALRKDDTHKKCFDYFLYVLPKPVSPANISFYDIIKKTHEQTKQRKIKNVKNLNVKN